VSIELKGMKTSREQAGASASGYAMLLVLLALAVLLVWKMAGNFPPDGAAQGENWALSRCCWVRPCCSCSWPAGSS
jgi:hypothetical protein